MTSVLKRRWRSGKSKSRSNSASPSKSEEIGLLAQERWTKRNPESIDSSGSESDEMDDWMQCRLMLKFALRHKTTLFIQLLATMGHIITRMLFPIVVGFAITTLTSTTDDIQISEGIMSFLCNHNLFLHCGTKLELLNSTVWCMVYVNVGQTTFNLLRKYFGGLTTKRMSSEIRNQLFHSILWHDLSFYECSEQWSSGRLLARLGADCNQFTGFSTFKIEKRASPQRRVKNYQLLILTMLYLVVHRNTPGML